MNNLDALHNAAERGDATEVSRLLKSCPDVDAKIDDYTALDLAVMGEHIDVCRTLLESGANATDSYKWSPKDESLLRLLVQHGCDPNKLFMPCSLEVNGAKALLELGADPNQVDERGQTPLYRACMKSARMVRLLLKYGANPLTRNTDDSHSLHFCAVWGHDARAKPLLDAGVPADYLECGEFTALPDACSCGHVKMAKLLLESGADPNLGDSLTRAANHGSAAIVELLLQHGANPTIEAREAAEQWLPDLLKEAKSRNSARGKLRHRWGRNSAGERTLELRTESLNSTLISISNWTDEHQRIVDLLSEA